MKEALDWEDNIKLVGKAVCYDRALEKTGNHKVERVAKRGEREYGR